jgi:hypothetical protein
MEVEILMLNEIGNPIKASSMCVLSFVARRNKTEQNN